jgi:uncharacterized membrane protein
MDSGFSRFSGVSIRWNIWVAAPLVLAFSALAVPYLWRQGSYAAALALQQGFALVCHQRPERSFWIFGYQVAVCARCLGIYLGAAIGLVLRTSRGVAVQMLVLAAALNLADVVTEVAGLHGNWMWLRFGLGFLLGGTGGCVISVALRRQDVEHLRLCSRRLA